MQPQSFFKGVYPIGESDPLDLPVRDLERALPFYVDALGFTVEARRAAPVASARLRRGDGRIGLAENGGDPEQASCYVDVDDVDRAFAECTARSLDVTGIRQDAHEGRAYRVFFLRAPDGLCYCLGQALEPASEAHRTG